MPLARQPRDELIIKKETHRRVSYPELGGVILELIAPVDGLDLDAFSGELSNIGV